jgi:hypothetical protein
VDSLHVEIDNLNDPLVGFCFIRSIDMAYIYKAGRKPIPRNGWSDLIPKGDWVEDVDHPNPCGNWYHIG